MFMKKIIKIIISLLVLAWIWYWSYFLYWYFKEKNSSKTNESLDNFNKNLAVDVVKQDMISSLNFIWSTKIKNEQKLKFNSESKVIWVYKKVWEYVKTWDLIAEIDKKEILSQIEISKITLENAQLKLKKLKEDNAEIDIKKAELELKNQKIDLENKEKNIDFFKKEQEKTLKNKENELISKNLEYSLLKKEVEKSLNDLNNDPKEKEQQIIGAENKLKIAEDEYDESIKNFDLNLQKKQNEYYTAVEKEYLDIKNSLNSLNKTFWEFDRLLNFKSNQWADNAYSLYFSVKNSKYKWLSTSYFYWSYKIYEEVEKEFEAIDDKYDIESILKLKPSLIKLYDNLLNASDSVMKWLDNSIEMWELDSWTISSFYSQWSSLYTESNSKLNSLKDLWVNLKTLKTPAKIKTEMENDLKSKKDEIENQKIALKKLREEKDYNSTTKDEKIEEQNIKLKNKKEEIDNVREEIEKLKINNEYDLKWKIKEIENQKIAIIESEKNLKDLKNKDNNKELILAENEVKQAQISLDNQVAKLSDYELKAPFEWLVTKNEYQVWDNLWANDDKQIIIENPNILEVSIFADQVDITKLSKWQKAIITYDAFPWSEFKWEIIEIDSTPQDKDWVTKYEVKVFLKKEKESIFSWMNAYVNIVTQEKLWVLAIPFSALKTDQNSWEEYVTVLTKDNKKEKRKVKSWYSDWANVEILEWLKQWEKVLEIDYDSNYYKWEEFEQMWWGMY